MCSEITTPSMSVTVPVQFRLKEDVKKQGSGADEDTPDSLAVLFHVPDDNDNDDAENHSSTSPTKVEVGSMSFLVQQPPDKGTLFAHQVWSGSRLLAQYVLDHPQLVQNMSTIEFGAGTALPSLAALKNGSKFTVITDYPDEDMLQAIRETVGHNWNTLYTQSSADGPLLEDRVVVAGHEWGTCTKAIQQQVTMAQQNIQTTEEDDDDDDDNENGTIRSDTMTSSLFDVALLSECLWNHSLHEKLAASLNALLHPTHGIAILTYAHHIPGLEEQDDSFFTFCQEQYGFQTLHQHTLTHTMPYMWDSTKTIPIQLKVMVRGGNTKMH